MSCTARRPRSLTGDRRTAGGKSRLSGTGGLLKVVALAVLSVALVEIPAVAVAAEPLHVRIDDLVEADKAPAAQLSSDAEFLRRVSLDLAGRIPTADETRRFLADTADDKRTKLIDALLAGPDYPRRMSDLFDVMLMERRAKGKVDPHWETFLRKSFETNKPWDRMVREILAPNPEDETARGAAFFYTKRLEHYGQNPIDYPGLTRDVGRLFMGVDLQCAQCHDHLFIDDYKQRDFQGLFAVYQTLTIRGGVEFPAVSEKAMTRKLEFVSVFDPTQRQTGPRIPFGQEFPVPEPPKEDKTGKPQQDQKKEGTGFSALPLIAKEMAAADNELFSRNIANRLWFVMMGRGLVEPLDMFHSDNPTSHPELLDLLARELAAHQFDIKWFLRELALTDTYQRSSLVPEGRPVPPPDRYLVAHEKRLSAEQLLTSALIATGNLERFTKPGEDGKPNKEFEDLKSRFLKAFANEPGEPETDFSASVKGALFLLNDSKLLGLLQPHEGNLVHRLAAMTDQDRMIDELFLSLFTRLPSDEEREAVASYLAKNADREKALGHVAWGMLTSMEFYVNH